MPAPPTLFWAKLGIALDLTGAIALASLVLWLWPRRARFGTAGSAVLMALAITAAWCLAIAALPIGAPGRDLVTFTESARNLSWLAVIYRLFASDDRHASLGPIRPVIYALVFVELVHLGIEVSLSRAAMNAHLNIAVRRVVFEFNVMFRLLVTVGGLVLVHNLYAGSARDARGGLRWPTVGLAGLWAFDLNLYTIAYLAAHWPAEIAALRGLAAIALAGFFALAAAHNSEDLRIRPSRAVTFQTFSLLVIGFYLVAMVAVAQWLSYAGGNFARLIELAFLTLASAIALVVLPSRRVRGWLKVILAKHFFQHRYDYREEWLRFTRTIGSGGAEAMPLGQRVVQALADVTDSPAGLLLCPGEHGDLSLAARWNWREIEVPADAVPVAATDFFERTNFITDLDDLRTGRAGQDGRAGQEGSLAGQLVLPAWLLDDARAWALVPLVHYERLVGLVVLARPHIVRKFDWEDLDLLRVIGQQLASYLAENGSQEALAEASRFDDFHRRIAFVMHDIKNLASQFSLLARNAELHAEKPEFRADMLVTLRASSEKLNALIARLSRYGSGAVDKLEPVAGEQVVAAVMQRFAGQPQVILTECQPQAITASYHSLEQVLVHLVQNAIDASQPGSPVFLSLTGDGLSARFEVVDAGTGMSPEFVRTRLFKPFVSTKSGGFGIGAFEARELVRAMRGRLDVESREGLGSRFVVRIPLAVANPTASIQLSPADMPTHQSKDQKVA